MHIDLLDILRCPYCGGRLELVSTLYHRSVEDQINDGVLACHCCVFPVVDGIPVMHLHAAATQAREQIETGQPQLALRTMIGLTDDQQAMQFDTAAASPHATYRDVVDAMGPGFEGGYFLYRFSDPTFIVANAVVRAVAATVLDRRRRAIDICGGSGHLTRSLLDLSSPPPVLADLFYPKVWLARRFTAPGCEPVCCDGNASLPFSRGAFGYAMCSDAFQYIWTKRQFVGEMCRLIDTGQPGAVVINHTHNQLTWSPSHGQPLSPAGYRDLFETVAPRLYGEAALFEDVIKGGPLDLSRHHDEEALNRDPALTIVASTDDRVYRQHEISQPQGLASELRINPLYRVDERDQELHLTLTFPDSAYEDEYGACRRYLPDAVVVPRAALTDLHGPDTPPALADLIRRRVIVALPQRYY